MAVIKKKRAVLKIRNHKSATPRFVQSDLFVALTTFMLHIFAWIKAEAASSSAHERQQEKTPRFWGTTVWIFNFGHSQVITSLAIYHDGHTRICCFSRVVSRVWLFNINYILLVWSVPDGGKVTITFVDSIVFRRNWWVHVSLELFNVWHSFYSHCFSQTIIIDQNGTKAPF